MQRVRPALTLTAWLLTSALACSGSRDPRGSLRIYLARHGQTDWNAEHRIQGSNDRALNATGREQAALLARQLEGVRLDAVYSSTLSRSRETAEIAHGLTPITSLAGLGERNLGKFEGERVDGSDPAVATEFQKRVHDPGDSLEGGESLSQFAERVRLTVVAIRAEHASGAILLIGHKFTNQMILRTLLELTLEQAVSIEQANDELYLVEIDAGSKPRLWKRVTDSNLSDL